MAKEPQPFFERDYNAENSVGYLLALCIELFQEIQPEGAERFVLACDGNMFEAYLSTRNDWGHETALGRVGSGIEPERALIGWLDWFHIEYQDQIEAYERELEQYDLPEDEEEEEKRGDDRE